jgi:hypothetical protein
MTGGGKMAIFKVRMVFGLVLILAGFLFDFCFLAPGISNAFKSDPAAYLNSFSRYMFDLTKTYMIILGLLNVALSFIPMLFLGAGSGKTDWIILGLMVAGSVVFIFAGLWYAAAGPSFKWETRCTVLTLGLCGIFLSIGLEIYRILFRTGARI